MDYKTTNPKINFSNKYIPALMLLIVASLFAVPGEVSAQSPATIILGNAKQIRNSADDVKDQVKAHFRGSKNYGKMLSASAQIKGRASTIVRRIKRDPYYKSLGKDLKKLDELTCKLNALFEEALIRAAKRLDDPIGNTRHVARKIHSMLEAVRWMALASR